MGAMSDDLRYAVRSLRRKPLLAAAAALILGLGIGGATAVFSVVDAVVLRALPYPDVDRLVRVWEVTPEGDRFSVSEPAYFELASAFRTLQPVAAYRDQAASVVLSDEGAPQRIRVIPVSASFTDVLGVGPQFGRTFTRDEDQPGVADRRVVLSDGLWRSRFNASPDVIGRIVTLDGNPFTVTGVMPPAFEFPANTDAWVPLAADPAADRTDKALAVIARLAPGATLAQAAGELREVSQRWSARYPESNRGWSAEAIPFSEWLIAPRFKDAVWVLFGAVTLLLMLACANIANLLLAHAMSRQGEMRMRTALGAPRGRLVRQLLTESAVIAAIGTVAGVLMAIWMIEALRVLGGGVLPRVDALRLDASVLLFGCAAGAASCIVFGVAPALYATRVDLRSGFDEGVRYTARSNGLRHALVVAEMALALLLLVGAGLLGNSFVRLLQIDPGFDLEATLAMPVEHTSAGYSDARIAAFYRDLLDRVRTIPGVVAAGATTTNPLRQGGYVNSVTPVEQAATAPPSGLLRAGWRSVTPEFFAAMGIPVLAGRVFTPSDHAEAERVVVVSERLAERLWPGESPIGKRIFWGGTSGTTRTVIGVSGDIRDVQLDAQPTPLLFVPHSQVDVPSLTVVIRSREPVERLGPAIRQALREMGVTGPAPPIYQLASSHDDVLSAPRFNVLLLGAFAAIALVLAITGVYSMLAFMVSERKREIAVRMALGASGAQVTSLVMRNGLRLSLFGAIAGGVAALAVTRLLSRLLYQVEPTDLATFTAATLALLAAATLASLLPARQAARVDAAALLNRSR